MENKIRNNPLLLYIEYRCLNSTHADMKVPGKYAFHAIMPHRAHHALEQFFIIHTEVKGFLMGTLL